MSTPNLKRRQSATKAREPSGNKGIDSANLTKAQKSAMDWRGQLKNPGTQVVPAASKPNLKKEPEPPVGSSRLDAIYAQLKELQNFKDEIMDDLDECMDDFDTQSHMGIIDKPPQFDQVVDIVV